MRRLPNTQLNTSHVRSSRHTPQAPDQDLTPINSFHTLPTYNISNQRTFRDIHIAEATQLYNDEQQQ